MPKSHVVRHQTLNIHHKDWDITNNSLDNLIVLCPQCHAKMERPPGTLVLPAILRQPVRRGLLIKRAHHRCQVCGRYILKGRASYLPGPVSDEEYFLTIRRERGVPWEYRARCSLLQSVIEKVERALTRMRRHLERGHQLICDLELLKLSVQKHQLQRPDCPGTFFRILSEFSKPLSGGRAVLATAPFFKAPSRKDVTKRVFM